MEEFMRETQIEMTSKSIKIDENIKMKDRNVPTANLKWSIEVIKKCFKKPDIIINPDTLQFLVAINRLDYAIKNNEMIAAEILTILRGEDLCLQ